MEDRTGELIRTHVEGLDEKMEGGIPQGKIVLVSGPSGGLKSSLVFSMLHHNTRGDKQGVYITLEQSRTSLYTHMRKLGIDAEEMDEKLHVLDLGFLRKELQAAGGEEENWLEFIKKVIKGYVEKSGVSIIGVDSLNALYTMSDLANPRKEIFHFFELMRDMGATCFFISETHGEGDMTFYGVEEFLSDGIIQLTMERTGRSISRYIRVVKMREVNHSSDYFPMIVEKGKMHIVTR
ncbi:MAG: circadian clock protein KaiC [Thermoplasmata archaeon]|nr:circadian clock protein KaiC [Thermoplasmata archaeon]